MFPKTELLNSCWKIFEKKTKNFRHSTTLIMGFNTSEFHLETQVPFQRKIVPPTLILKSHEVIVNIHIFFYSFWFSCYTHNSSLILLILFYCLDMSQERMQYLMHTYQQFVFSRGKIQRMLTLLQQAMGQQ